MPGRAEARNLSGRDKGVRSKSSKLLKVLPPYAPDFVQAESDGKATGMAQADRSDFAAAHRLKQQPWMLELERRTIVALEALGILMTNTCINYQTIMPPVLGEHVAYGDTGVVIYCNSVCGARSNFEGGPSALSAALTGRTP